MNPSKVRRPSFKTESQKPAAVTRSWHIIDANDASLGRLATAVSQLLVGKQKPTYTPHVDGGDYVIVVNAASVYISGQKSQTKVYYRHSGYVGNLKKISFRQQQERDPTRVIQLAVRGMLPKNKLRNDRLKRLKVYSGSDHPHDGQKPTPAKIS